MLNITETNVTVLTKNMNTAIEFYENLGLTLKQRWDDHYAMITAPGLTIGLHPMHGDVAATSQVSIGFMIDKIGDATELLDKNEITYTTNEDKSGIITSFKDHDGTNLYFMQPKWK